MRKLVVCRQWWCKKQAGNILLNKRWKITHKLCKNLIDSSPWPKIDTFYVYNFGDILILRSVCPCRLGLFASFIDVVMIAVSTNA